MKKPALLATSLTALATVPATALAHVGDHDASHLMATLEHLLSSADHVLLFVIAGIVTSGFALHRRRAQITKLVRQLRHSGRSHKKR